eukprot:CAMPEP_0174856752 /NCGR_PEP_ID=MMETSP1114-20130205/36197_1 /TAXON_ID=312471 /ORGANISM="Neobodo designis, Strain CCAP 1951/1" /LENGTH=525 /DNA_ID=CAMNT_0016091557 /DNA_START=35 /DNA_END=1612 /DNA_ORIENTATION=-
MWLRRAFGTIVLFAVLGVAAAETSTYRVASLMHTPVGIHLGATVRSIIDGNLELYYGYAVDAQSAGAQLLLYPESGTGFLQVPPPDLRLLCEPTPAIGFTADQSLCNSTEKFVNNATGMIHSVFASCASRTMGIDVVINFCAYDAYDRAYYNVDVAFAAGAVGAVYVKSHITGTGPYLSQPWRPDAVTFKSSFGVTFGMFTCYDFWFAEPQNEEMRAGVRDFLFPSEMASGPPFFTVTAAAAGWSHLHGINVVGSASFGTGFVGAVTNGTVLDVFPPMPANFTNAHAMVVNDVPTLRKSTFTRAAAVVDDTVGDVAPASVPADRCTYGPAQNSFLNFTYPCNAFKPVAGTVYSFSLHNEVDGYSMSCNGTFTVASTSNDTWMFGAILVVPEPSVSTPTSAATSMCLLSRCTSYPSGCMAESPLLGWDTDLQVGSVRVTTRLAGKFASSSAPVTVYPIAVWSDRLPGTAHSIPVQQTVLNRTQLSTRASRDSDRSTVAFMSTTSKAAPVLRTEKLWSFGVYADQLV